MTTVTKVILLKNHTASSAANSKSMAHKIVISPLAHIDELKRMSGMNCNAPAWVKNSFQSW
jgi:hypothetical protein